MAGGRKTADIVREIAEPVCRDLGLVLWDVRFEKEGPDWFLRIFIDKDGDYVSIDDCEAVSRAVDPLLDRADPISGSYCLEVSSPGLGRKLTKPFHFEKKMGREVLARLIRASEDGKEIKGTLTGFSDGNITIADSSGKLTVIPLEKTAYVKLCDDEDLF